MANIVNLDWLDSLDSDAESVKRIQDTEQRYREAQIVEIEQKNVKRFQYAKYFLWIATGWLGLVGLVVLLNGFGALSFEISDNVLMILLGTATANVLYPAHLIAKYLFNS